MVLGGIDPVLAGLVVFFLLLVFFIYLFLRRTVQGFKEGVDQSRK